MFDKWSSHNPDATELIKWMNFPAPPPFGKGVVPSDMDMLAEISNLATNEAKVLQTRYHELRSNFYIRGQKFTAKALRPLACPPLTPALLARLCYLWGDNHGGEMAFREVLQGVSVCCRGSPKQFALLLFKTFDIDDKGFLDHSNIRMLLSVADELKHTRNRVRASNRERTISTASVTSKEEFEDEVPIELEDEADDLPPGDCPFQLGPNYGGDEEMLKTIFVWGDGVKLTVPQFSEWVEKARTTIDLIRRPLAFLGNTVFALRPKTLQEEGLVVDTQMRQDETTGLVRTHGNQCYLLSRAWFDVWRVYVGLTGSTNGEARAPGPIDNSCLLAKPASMMEKTLSSTKRTFTSRGLKKGLEEDRDFVVVSETVWAMLSLWYTGEPRLSRPIIARNGGSARIELYPLTVRVLQHVTSKNGGEKKESAEHKKDKGPHVSFLLLTECSRTQTIKQLAHSICIQQKGIKRGNAQLKVNSVRLWDYEDSSKPRLLEPEWEAGELHDGQTVLLEVRNKDLSWPSELAMATTGKGSKAPVETVFGSTVKREPGATGLSNLGNTCFLNAAVQCLSNTDVLREYFLRKCYRAEINRTNVLGSKGAIAIAQGQLIQRLWCGKTSVAPQRLRETVIKHAPQFQGYEQHDSQEFLNFVIDALHEDLNRIVKPPYVERQDSNLRPDHVVAAESWEGHQKRNRSVVVDLLHGQLKSTLRCKHCQFVSVSFDPFTFLTLPLPTENETTVDIKLTRQRGGVPEIFSVGVEQGCTFSAVKKKFADLIANDPDCNDVAPESILFIEFPGTSSQRLIDENHKIRQMKGHLLYAYEVRPNVVEQTLHEDHEDKFESDRICNSQSAESPPSTGVSLGESANVVERGDSPTTSLRRNSSDVGSKTQNIVDSAGEEARRFTIPGHVFAVHRKQESVATHFLTLPCRHQIFSSPILIPIEVTMTNSLLYDFVWAQVAHFLVPQFRAKVDANKDYPFELTQLGKTRVTCDPRKCSWGRFCSGCTIPNNDSVFNSHAHFIGIDWKPREYCLYFDVSQDTRFNLHSSVEAMKAKEKEPIELVDCLKAFTKEEDMSKDDLWYCPKCKEHRQASKKLDIWALPPVLIIHLKRFHMLNGRWVKSQRHVNFPVNGLDIFDHLENRPAYQPAPASVAPTSDLKRATTDAEESIAAGEGSAVERNDDSTPERSVSGSPVLGTIVPDIEKLDPHAKFYTDPKGPRMYDLTSMTIHLGIMGGGHYVAYAKNPNNKWYYYNDSSCKEVPAERVAREDGYCLFYTARGIDKERILPHCGDDQDGVGSDQEEEEEDGKLKRDGPCIIS